MRVGDKIFTGWELGEGGKTWSFNVKLDKDKQAALVASEPRRFSVAPYVGKHGWVTVTVVKGKERWGEIEALVDEGYANVAPKKKGKSKEPGAGKGTGRSKGRTKGRAT